MSKFSVSLFLALLVGVLGSADALAYTIERGDVLEVAVVGVPGLHRKAPVDQDGRFSMPLVGDVAAAGFSTHELQEKIRDLLIEKNVVRRPEVAVDIAEYRPVYVGGDVMKPGAYSFRSDMTVRDAVALAEGFDLLHLRGRDPLTVAADAKGDFQSAAVELAKDTARVARLNAELAGSKELDTATLKALTVQPSIIAEVTQIERQQLAADVENAEREKASIERTITALREQIASLHEEENAASASFDDQSHNLNRARELMQRGLLQAVRLEENQRAAAAAQTLLYDIRTRAAQARREMEDGTRRLQVADDERRVRLLQDLRETVVLLETAKVKLQAAAEKVRFTDIAQINAQNIGTSPPEIVIYRNSGSGSQTVQADVTVPLQPGDNVEVTTKVDLAKLLGNAR